MSDELRAFHSSLITHHSSLLFDSHLVEGAGRVAPVLLDLDEEFEVDAPPDEALDVAAAARAAGAPTRAAAAPDDLFLRGGVPVNSVLKSRGCFTALFLA